jgi:hypothetical protein
MLKPSTNLAPASASARERASSSAPVVITSSSRKIRKLSTRPAFPHCKSATYRFNRSAAAQPGLRSAGRTRSGFRRRGPKALSANRSYAGPRSGAQRLGMPGRPSARFTAKGGQSVVRSAGISGMPHFVAWQTDSRGRNKKWFSPQGTNRGAMFDSLFLIRSLTIGWIHFRSGVR